MMKKYIVSFIFLTLSLLPAIGTEVYIFDITQEINSTTWIYTQKALREANMSQAECIILRLNTYGGEVTYADSIRTAILYHNTPVIAYIDNNAASAGALISLACDKIYMRHGSSIGAATVVNGVDGQAMPDKYQSYMRSIMRSTAEAHGKDSVGCWVRNPQIAEAMVDESIEIKGVIERGKTLTFTAQEAVNNGYCEGIVDSIPQILEIEGYDVQQCNIKQFQPTATDSAKGWLLNTTLRSILIMLILGGLYFELQQPGIGFPLLISIGASILYFAPLYIEGLAANWEIIIFVVGIVLIVLELFVTPGFGVLGISGILIVIMSLVFAMLNNVDFDFSNVTIPDISQSLATVFIGLIITILAAIWLSTKIGSKGIWAKMALTTSQQTEHGYVGVDTSVNKLIGSLAFTSTDLHPSGKISVDNRVYDAVAIHSFIPKGSKVKIIRIESGRCYVDKML